MRHRRARHVSALAAALRKDLLLQWRTRAQVVAVFVFGATALLLFSFAIGPNTAALRQHAAGFLWLGLLLSSTLALAESFHERDGAPRAGGAAAAARRPARPSTTRRRSPTRCSSRCWAWRSCR